MDFSTIALTDLLTTVGLVVSVGGAAIGLLVELHRAAVDRAAKMVAWTAIPHDGIGSAGLRGIVIVNNTEQVVTQVDAIVRSTATTGDITILDRYPVVPPGAHFLTFQERNPGSDVWDVPPPAGFWLIPVSNHDGELRIALRKGGSDDTAEDSIEAKVEYDLRPWIDSEGESGFVIDNFAYTLGNTTWSRSADKKLRRDSRWTRLWSARLRRRHLRIAELTATAKAELGSSTKGELSRRLPLVAQSEAQIQYETEQAYPLASTLMDRVAALLVAAERLDAGRTEAPAPALAALGVAAVRRSKTRRTEKYGQRGGLALEFFLRDDAGKPTRKAYSFGMSQQGDAPQWFLREPDEGSGRLRRDFKAEERFKRKKAGDWQADGTDLAAAIITAIQGDITVFTERRA